jgi:hypothetical protein
MAMSPTETHAKSKGTSKTEELKSRGTALEEPMMKAEPQKEHQWLQKLVGEWTYEGEMTMEPGKPAEKFRGTESVRSIGDLWIQAEGQSQMPDGSPVTTILTLGYEVPKERFVGAFIASMESHLWLYDGGLNENEKTLTLNTEGPNMMAGGQMAKFRDVMEIEGDDHRILTSHILSDDGKWQKVMTIHYRRTE